MAADRVNVPPAHVADENQGSQPGGAHAVGGAAWMQDVTFGDLGYSFWSGEPPRDQVLRRGPALAIALMMMTANLVGDGLRNILDPRTGQAVRRK